MLPTSPGEVPMVSLGGVVPLGSRDDIDLMVGSEAVREGVKEKDGVAERDCC